MDGAGQFAKTAAGATATVELSDVAPGTYTLSVLFYGDEAKTVLLNTYRELVRVSAGLVSRAERSIDLNELYEISYKYYLDGAEVTGETQIAEIIASVSGGTLPENFSRRSAIALPELSHDGWEFAGWYPTASINSENKMTEIAGGSTGDKNLCAIFVTSSSVAADIYVASFGNSAGTGTQVDPLDSIAAAMAKIIGAPDSLKDWVIAINGTLEGCQSLDFSDGSAPAPSTCAKSITLTGIRAFDADVGKPKDWIDGGSGWDVSEIMYSGGGSAHETNEGCAALEVTACDVPLTIKNLGIKGGYGHFGGGIWFSRSDKLTLGENAYVTQNLSSNSGGGICVDSSTVILDGGTIEQNKAIGSMFGGGGGVYITDYATFTLKSGSVLNNWLDAGANDGGAGVCVDGGAFKMEGGTVANNVSVHNITGGVYVKGQFNMTGGSISGNKAYPASYDPDASFEGRGVYVDTVDTENDNVPFTIGQDAFIASDNDIYLMYDSTREILPKIKITSALSGYEAGKKITITPDEHGYVNNMPVLFDDASGALVAQCHDLFAVTPQSDPVVEWSVNSSGCLTDGSGTSGSVPADFVEVTGATISGQVGNSDMSDLSQVFILDRSVTIRDLYVCDHEVTQGEYTQYMYYAYKSAPTEGENYPAYNMNWVEACMYCNLRSAAEHLNPVYYITPAEEAIYDISEWKTYTTKIETSGGKYTLNSGDRLSVFYDAEKGIKMDTTANGYRLLTEAEWEYCARGGNGLSGTQTKYSGSDTLANVAWYKDNSSSKLHEVKTNKVTSPDIIDSANALGLYDMSGNVYEFCFDWKYAISETTPSVISDFNGSDSGYGKVVRGGSYASWSSDDELKVYYRSQYTIESRGEQYGFRVCRNK